MVKSNELHLQIQIVSNELNIPYKWLDDTIYLESNYNHKIVNEIGATGLIQFVRKTAKWLGTTTIALQQMTITEQMVYVKKYLKSMLNQYGMPKDFISFYCFVFNPAFSRSGLDATLPSAAYYGNRFFDINKDGKVSKRELQYSVEKRLAKRNNTPQAELNNLKNKLFETGNKLKQQAKSTITNAFQAIKNDNTNSPIKILLIATAVIATIFILVKIVKRIFIRR